MALAFLNRMDREWKRKYIATYMPVGGPFAGNVMNVMGIISGAPDGPHSPGQGYWFLAMQPVCAGPSDVTCSGPSTIRLTPGSDAETRPCHAPS